MGTKPKERKGGRTSFCLRDDHFSSQFSQCRAHFLTRFLTILRCSHLLQTFFPGGKKNIFQNLYSFHHEEGGILSKGYDHWICNALYIAFSVPSKDPDSDIFFFFLTGSKENQKEEPFLDQKNTEGRDEFFRSGTCCCSYPDRGV